MTVNKKEKEILRELGKKYAELAALPQQMERYERGRDINDLKPRRPMVWIDEIPWHEMDIDGKLKLSCEDEFARQMEWFFRSMLYRWEYIQADTVLWNEYSIPKNYTNTGVGLKVQENNLATDENNHITSHGYIDQLDSMEKLENLREPEIKADKVLDAKQLEWASDILDGIMPVRLRGYYVYHAPWDQIPRYRGVTPILMDLALRPDLIHATIKKFTEYYMSGWRQMEANDLLDMHTPELHCTPPYSSDLKSKKDGSGVKMKDIWFRAMAQMFSDISPEMWKEFELDYMKPLAAKFGLLYYGCCEALDNKIEMLKTIPKLRKVGVSPWANAENCAEQLGGDYVYAHKPNPAHVSGSFDAKTVRDEISRVIKTCKENNCPYEFVLKDISTVTYKPSNLIEWTQTVMEVINEAY